MMMTISSRVSFLRSFPTSQRYASRASSTTQMTFQFILQLLMNFIRIWLHCIKMNSISGNGWIEWCCMRSLMEAARLRIILVCCRRSLLVSRNTFHWSSHCCCTASTHSSSTTYSRFTRVMTFLSLLTFMTMLP